MFIEPILPGKVYHIYNRGNNSTDIFFEKSNYELFLRLYRKYIDPIAETYAWCLMKNHFHILVYLKSMDEINPMELSYTTVEKPKIISHSSQFSHFLNAYTQSINKSYCRTGSIFEKPFHRKPVEDQDYFESLIHYIHNNPVKHGFSQRIQDYPWSSYGEIIQNKSVLLKNPKEIIDQFHGLSNFQTFHQEKLNSEGGFNFVTR